MFVHGTVHTHPTHTFIEVVTFPGLKHEQKTTSALWSFNTPDFWQASPTQGSYRLLIIGSLIVFSLSVPGDTEYSIQYIRLRQLRVVKELFKYADDWSK